MRRDPVVEMEIAKGLFPSKGQAEEAVAEGDAVTEMWTF
jgi:hypothetical protein